MAQQSLAQKSKELRKAQGDYQQATSHIEQLQAQLSNTQQRLTAAKEKKQQLEEQVAPLVSYPQTPSVVICSHNFLADFTHFAPKV